MIKQRKKETGEKLEELEKQEALVGQKRMKFRAKITAPPEISMMPEMRKHIKTLIAAYDKQQKMAGAESESSEEESEASEEEEESDDESDDEAGGKRMKKW